DAALGVEDPVRSRHRPVRPEVGQQPELEVLLVRPGPVGERGVDRDGQQHRAGIRRHLGEGVPHRAQLTAAHPAEGQRVEHEHDVLRPPEPRQAYWCAVLVPQLEIRCLLAYLNAHAPQRTPAGTRTGPDVEPRLVRKISALLLVPPAWSRTSHGPRSRSTSETSPPWEPPLRYRSARRGLACPPSASATRCNPQRRAE